uniref:Nuclear protein, ataxia-telangiectasia locus n=1 Tax=Xenopus tropicalis TaxID=8364 RepID=A0A6I8R452_XENTR
MLLPSDVARLVLGYLQQEKLSSTCQSFILESPNLKEYAEHYTDEGSIPGCVLSLFGKNLTTILNEYIAMKAKGKVESGYFLQQLTWVLLPQVIITPFTLFPCTVRTRYGIQDLRHQRMLTSHAASTGSAMACQQTSTPIAAKQVMLRSFVSQSASPTIVSPLVIGQSTIQCTNSPATESKGETLQNSALSAAEKKQTSSPMRRKADCQRRRRVAPLNSSTATEGETEGDADSLQELIDGNFPQLVIENAREKILSNKSLQEKLAENINKFLGSDAAAHAAKPSEGGALEQDTSIDEILGLQGGEIHMSEEAIHDILEQTELDPDFQELYDLFACSSTKTTKTASRDPPLQTEGVASSNTLVANDNLEPMESSFEGDTTSHSSNPTGVGAEQKKDPTPILTTQSTESTGLPSKAQGIPTSGSDRSAMSDQSVESKKRTDSIIILDSTGSDTVVESSEDVQVTPMEIAVSQSQDVEMKNISHRDVVETNCQLAKEAAPLSVDLTVHGVQNSKKETPKERAPEKTSKAKKSTPLKNEISDSRQVERDKSEGPAEEHTAQSQNIVVLVSIGSPVTESNLLNDKNQQGEVNATPSKIDTPIDSTVSEPLQAESSIASKELKVPQKPSKADKTPPHPVVPSVSPAIKGASSSSDGSSLPLQVSSSVAVPAPVSSNVEQSCIGMSSIDPSQIITLSFITEDIPEDAELTKAVKSISERGNSALLLSPFQKLQESSSIVSNPGPSTETSGLALLDQREVVTVSSDVAAGVKPAEECTIFSLPGTSNLSTDGGIIQLMPATSSSFAPSGSFFISTCNTGGAQQSNIMVVPSNCAPAASQKQPCHYQTPPRPHSVYTVGQAISPKISQGSTFILASAMQPVLPGVVGMFPLSVVGQSSNAFAAPSHQVLHVPVSQGVPKLPLPPKSQKLPSTRNLASAAEKQGVASTTDSVSRTSSSRGQRSENVDKNSAAVSQNKPEERQTGSTNPSTKAAENHKRVLCFENSAANRGTANTKSVNNSSAPQNKDMVETVNSSGASSALLPSKQSGKDSKPDKKAPSTETNSKSESVPSKQPVVPAPKDLSGDKKTVAVALSAEVHGGVMANKENMLQKENKKQELPESNKKPASSDGAAGNSERAAQPTHETGRKLASLPSILRRTKLSTERMCPTSPLTKQASDLLQSMQFNSPNAKHFSGGDLPIPRTPGSGIDDRLVDNHPDHMKTPKSKRYHEDGGTPKPMLPPATPELPACSPASETGSENSVNMAAHTLMILSRATLAKTDSSSPLKDNTQQLKLSKSSSKKRKLDEPDEYERRPHKKELQSPSAILKRKKIKKHRKKSTDAFPAGMDVDKFLMSLHYDE